MDILRIDKDTYQVGRCFVKRVPEGWECRPSSSRHNDRALFVKPTLDACLDFCAGVQRMMAPADDYQPEVEDLDYQREPW